MRQPEPPFLELQFAFASRIRSDNLISLVMALHDLGAKFVGKGEVQRGPGIDESPFALVLDEPLEQVSITSTADLQQYCENSDVRLMRVYMEGASGTTKRVEEVITYVDTSHLAATKSHHPVAVWTDGEVFSGVFRDSDAARALKIGDRARVRFLSVIDATKPEYAAITSEYNLQPLAALQSKPKSNAFRVFYVSEELVGLSVMHQIKRMFEPAYTEPTADGLYVSTMREFSPSRVECDIEWALERSNSVARLLGSVSRPCT